MTELRAYDPDGDRVTLRLEDVDDHLGEGKVGALVYGPDKSPSWDRDTVAFDLSEDEAMTLGWELVQRAIMARARRELLR